MKWSVAVIAVAALAVCVYSQAPRFVGKKVLVTGGSSGIGFETALQFAREGANVVFCARDLKGGCQQHSGKEAESIINSDDTVTKNKGSARFVQADVTKADDVAALFESIRKTEGYLDVAVNNAGISGAVGKLGDTSAYTATANDPITNNVYGAIRCIAEEEAMMVMNNISGSIVTVSSVQGLVPASNMSRYCAASHALIGLTKSVALQHITGIDGPYIRANIVAPARVATPFAFNLVKEKKQPWEDNCITEDSKEWTDALPTVVKHIPMLRVARPEEVAKTIAWLCTDDAEQISGDTLTVDGGVWAA